MSRAGEPANLLSATAKATATATATAPALASDLLVRQLVR